MTGTSRLRAGGPGLDAILGGGLTGNAIHIVMGAPGVGKTIFAEQLVFANATPKRPALYLTTLSEPFAKTLTYLQQLDFFDADRIGADIHYEDLGPGLAADGPGPVTGAIEELLKTYRPGLLVIDSFKAIQDIQPSLAERRRWLHELAGLLSAYRMTTLWLGEYGQDEIVRQPEFAVADGILEFANVPQGIRDRRYLHVHKLRGSDFQSGAHTVTLSRAGLAAWPRLVTPHVAPSYSTVRERLCSGVPGLDDLLDSGFLRGSATLVAGPSGSGKTAVGLHFVLEGARLGEPSLFVHFQENPTQLAQIVKAFDRDPAGDIAAGRLAFLYQSPVELEIDSLVHRVFERLRAMGARRMVLDALGDLAGACSDSRRFHDYLYAMLQHCAVENIACLITLETANLLGTERISEGDISPVCDNILLLELQTGPRTERTLRVLKTRGSGHDAREHRLSITSRGPAVE